MAELGISLAEKLIEVLATDAIKVVCEIWNYKEDLEKLKETVSTIHNVLLDADVKRDHTNEQQHYIKKLKDVLYDADDLFDEFLTLTELKQLGPRSKRREFLEKVSRFFSSYRMSRDVKEIKERLGNIAYNYNTFGFRVDYKPIIRRRPETCSYIDATEIIGREGDKKAIIDMLLNTANNNEDDFCFVTIVGVGGLGKTALAQLVFNDKRITNEFADSLRLWVCVSDQDGVLFDVKTILCKILELVIKEKVDVSTSLEFLRHRLRDGLRGQKYLLVLDDVWNENREMWLNLKRLLMLGHGGSRVLVTTRSKTTGTIIDEKHVYELPGLSEVNSWRLFEMSAFHKEDKPENNEKFVEIGLKIVKKCYNNPLAIKVVGSLLFGQDISKWESLEHTGFTKTVNFNNEILPILKLSYHNLTLPLKNCFIYCALFPKDYRIEKQKLIDLWVAQRYLDDNEDMEDAAEEHFLILLKRCFFQDVKKDEYGNIESVKIHDLMHDVAQEVGREEICEVTCNSNFFGDRIRHVRCDNGDILDKPWGSSKIRSFVCKTGYCPNAVDDRQIESWKCLRVLDVSNTGLEKVPKSVGKLLLLRYLDLSSNDYLEVLPHEITKLHNLQTLILQKCRKLRQLPAKFKKLVKLRHLDLRMCDQLKCMPWGMNKLTSLKVLPLVFVGKQDGTTSVGLNSLKALSGIRGEMMIEIGEYYRPQVELDMGESGEVVGYLKSMKHLTKLDIHFEVKVGCDNPEAVLVNLEPPSYVKQLSIRKYMGTEIPKWGRAVDNWASSLSCLVDIHLYFCENLKEMPVLSKLRVLKSLVLDNLNKLEYMEMTMKMESDAVFFPSLVRLEMKELIELKGWWKENSSSVVDDQNYCSDYKRLAFPCLSTLKISSCHNLTSFPLCPLMEIEELELEGNNASLQLRENTGGDVDNNKAGNSKKDPKLRQLTTDNMGYLKSLPINRLKNLQISSRYQELYEELPVGSHVLKVLASSLQTLQIESMHILKRLCRPNGLQQFTALEQLSLENKRPLKENEEEKLEAYCFPPNLRSLEFNSFKKIKCLPKGMRFLTSLETLTIQSCWKLEVLPEWMSRLSSLKSLKLSESPALKSFPQAMLKLTSLQSLKILSCPELKKRYQNTGGEEHCKIQHIPNIWIF